MEEQIEKKARKLAKIITKLGSILVAFSGGTDSALILKVASDNLPREKTLAVIGSSPIFPSRETSFAAEFSKALGVPYKIIKTNEMDKRNFTRNKRNHCYICKRGFFSTLTKLANKNHLAFVVDGTNYDDIKEDRPSFKALEELNIRHPLAEAKLRKDEIRSLSKYLGLPTWNKLPQPCFASRISLGIEITRENIIKIAKAEEWLRNQGFESPIVRLHPEGMARLKLKQKDAFRCFESSMRDKIIRKFKRLGFSLVVLALEER